MKNPSPWKVTSTPINGKTMYGVYRKIDADAIDHSGNRQMHGGYTSNRDEAAALAERLNGKEAEASWKS